MAWQKYEASDQAGIYNNILTSAPRLGIIDCIITTRMKLQQPMKSPVLQQYVVQQCLLQNKQCL
mgnify:FL=1